jgi:hypothetical protein
MDDARPSRSFMHANANANDTLFTKMLQDAENERRHSPVADLLSSGGITLSTPHRRQPFLRQACMCLPLERSAFDFQTRFLSRRIQGFVAVDDFNMLFGL